MTSQAVLGQETVEFEGASLGFLVNDRGTIDATAFFHAAEFMDGGPDAWLLADAPRVTGIILHHWAGWYGGPLDAGASSSEEFAQLVAMARDHRAQFGIGPGYNVAVFPSARRWAIGKHGTHRAHTIGREPATRERWNVTGRAVAVAGNYETEPVTRRLGLAIRLAVEEVQSWPGVAPGTAVYEHGIIPTSNAAGVLYSQATACPGRNVAAWRAGGGLTIAGEESHQPDRWSEGYRQGYKTGHGSGVKAAVDRIDQGAADALRLLVAPPEPPTIPAAPALVAGVA